MNPKVQIPMATNHPIIVVTSPTDQTFKDSIYPNAAQASNRLSVSRGHIDLEALENRRKKYFRAKRLRTDLRVLIAVFGTVCIGLAVAAFVVYGTGARSWAAAGH